MPRRSARLVLDVIRAGMGSSGTAHLRPTQNLRERTDKSELGKSGRRDRCSDRCALEAVRLGEHLSPQSLLGAGAIIAAVGSWMASMAVSETGRPISLANGRWPMPTMAILS